MVIPVTGYLAGILTIHFLYDYGGLPFFLSSRLHGILFLLIILSIGGFLYFYLLPRYTSLRFPGVCYSLSVAALFFTGSWSYCRQNNLNALPQNSELTTVYGEVERVAPTKSKRFMRINTRLLAYRQEDESVQCNIKSFIYIPIENYEPNLQAGSKIWTLSKIQTDNSMPPSLFLSRSSPLGFTPQKRPFPARLGEGVLEYLKTHISDPNSFALIAGLSLGNKEAFDPELKRAYASSGAMHILAVSGLHVGIIYAIIQLVFNLLIPGNKRSVRTLKQILAFGALTLFAAMARFTPSVTRALLMVGLSMSGSWIKRPVHSLQTLFTTALLICVFNPAAIFEIGFQLSFCAVLAILTLHPPLHGLLRPKTKVGKYLWTLITMSVVAQMGTAPLAYHYFGIFPYLFLLTNLFIIPLTGILLHILCAWLALGQIPWIGSALLWILENTAWLMNSIVIWVDRLL